MAQNFTDSSLKELIASGAPVVVDFWAPWCGPCKRLAPTVEALAEEYAGRVEIGKYNIDEENDLATDFRVRSIPTLLFFKNGEQIADLRMVGTQSEDNVRANIEGLLAR